MTGATRRGRPGSANTGVFVAPSRWVSRAAGRIRNYNFLPDQSFDVTKLRDGLYRLRATADPDRVLRESNESGAVLELTTSTYYPKLRIVGYGPSAAPGRGSARGRRSGTGWDDAPQLAVVER